MSKTLEEIFESLIRTPHLTTDRLSEPIKESIDNKDKIVRFVVPATIDMSVNKDEILSAYSYSEYVADIQAGVKPKEIIDKLGVIVENLAKQKIIQAGIAATNMDIETDNPPSIQKAQFYRFSFEMFLEEYNTIYQDFLDY